VKDQKILYVGWGFYPGLFVGVLMMTLFGKAAAGRYAEALVTLVVMVVIWAVVGVSNQYWKAKAKLQGAMLEPDKSVPVSRAGSGDGTTQQIVSR
jgi:hypothetical protein